MTLVAVLDRAFLQPRQFGDISTVWRVAFRGSEIANIFVLTPVVKSPARLP